MKILDLRNRHVRRAEQWWRRWETEKPAAVRLLHVPAAAAARTALALIRAGRGQPPARPLLGSVGNLALGGTGKTPVVGQLARDRGRRGIAGAVLTRGYGAVAAGPLLVAADDPQAGDEARLLAAMVADTDWTVVQARRRRRGLDWLLGRPGVPPVVLIEDGHQTRDVPRHLDILILDRWTLHDRGGGSELVPDTGFVLPWGPYREPPAAAATADVWLVERDQPLPPSVHVTGTSPPQLCVFSRRAELATAATTVLASTVPPEAPDGTPPASLQPLYATLAGIARPERFERDCIRLVGYPPALAVRCDDHARYDPALVSAAVAAGAELNIALWLTTAKDLIKLRSEDFPVPITAVRQRLVWHGTQTLPDLVEERLAQED